MKVICNSGASKIRIFRIHRDKYLKVGAIIQASVISINKSVNSKVKRKDKVFGVIVHLKQHCKRLDGTIIRFSINSVVLIKNPSDTTMIGNRINYIVPAEIQTKFPSIAQSSLGIC